MPKPAFEALARQLSEAGIAPRFVIRLRRELQDHFADLEEEALRTDECPAAAESEALARLGCDDLIAHEFMSRPELRSWIYTSRTLLFFLRAASWLVVLVLRAVAALGSLPMTLARYTAAAALALVVTGTFLMGLQFVVGGGAADDGSARVAHAVATSGIPVRPAPPEPAPVPEEEPKVSGVALQVRVSPLLNPPPADLEPLWRPGELLAAEPPVAPKPMAALAAADFGIADGDYLPIVKVAPVFPSAAALRGLEGYVVVEYTVTPGGTVQNPTVVESSSSLFERSAVEAVSQFKYKPRFLGGRPVAVSGVRTKVSYLLEV